MLRPRAGFALLDALLACWALALALSPLLVAQAQAARDAGMLHTRVRLILLAASTADRLRQVPQAQSADALLRMNRELQAGSGSRETGVHRVNAQTVRLVLRWRDAGAHRVEWLLRLP